MLSLRQDDWDAVADRIARGEGPIAWAWLAIREAGTWTLLVLTVRGATAVPTRDLRYEGVWFGSQTLSPRVAARRFREGTIGRRSRNAPAFQKVQGQASVRWHTTEPTGLRLTRGDWPRYVAEFRWNLPNLTVPNRYDPLSAPGQPFYPSVMVAAAEILYGVPPADLGNDLSPTVRVVLPDRRARLGAVRFDDGVALVPIEEGTPDSATGLLLRAAWREEPTDTEWRSHDEPAHAGDQRVPTPTIPAHMSIVVMDRDGRILDRREWGPEDRDRPRAVSVSAEQILRWISEGESATLECKQDLGSESVRRSLAETVAAFANGSGGVVLLGVTKEYEVVGYDPDFSVADQVTNLIDDLVREPPALRVDRVPVEGTAVHVVTVDASDPDRRPHMVGGHAYHRANSRTRVGYPGEIRRMTRQERPPRGMSPFGL